LVDRTSRFNGMPGCYDSNSPFSCSSVFICGLPTMATLTVPLAPLAAGLAAGAVVGAAPAGAVVGAAAGLAAAGALVAGGAAAGAHAAASRPKAAVSEAADRRQWPVPVRASRKAFIPCSFPQVPMPYVSI